MGTFSQILLLLFAAFLIWQLIRYVRANPGAFSKDKLHRGFFTLGILALLLIGFIALCVILLKIH
jgi:hypothetical protein